jgi:hypothetical protein
VELSGTPPFGYQWRRESSSLHAPGAGGATFTIENVQLSHAGNYTVMATDAAHLFPGVLISEAALRVLEPFTLQALRGPGLEPAMVRFNALSNISFSVQYQEELGAPWQTLTNISSVSTNRLIQIDQGRIEHGPQRFFRLTTPRFP